MLRRLLRLCIRWRVLAGVVWLSVVGGEVVGAAAPRFVEVTVEAGIDFRYINGASGAKYMPEAVGSGAAFFDGDGDGFLDLYIVNGAALPGYEGPTGPNAYYRNRADGTFVDATVESGDGRRSLWHGGGRRRYRQRWRPRPLCRQLWPQPALRKRWAGGFCRCRGRAWCGRPGLGYARGFCRLRWRWRPRPLRRQLHGF